MKGGKDGGDFKAAEEVRVRALPGVLPCTEFDFP